MRLDRDAMDLSGSDISRDYYEPYISVATRVFVFSGSLAAGKTVEIDGVLFTVKNDGVNAIGDFSGDFPVIFPASVQVTYTDSEGSRSVGISIAQPGPPNTSEVAKTVTITYTGSLAVGHTVVFDGSDLTVIKEGVNDMAHFSGDFPRIFPGSNTITYADSGAARTAVVVVERQERSV